jgi:transcriptional regulator with XRE-family HTH domain
MSGTKLEPGMHRALADRLAANVRSARKRAGISQEELGFLASVHRTEIGSIERGLRLPRLDTLVKVAQTLGVSIDSLAEGITWQRPPGGIGVGRLQTSEEEEEERGKEEREED